jgi:hypothetical protein
MTSDAIGRPVNRIEQEHAAWFQDSSYLVQGLVKIANVLKYVNTNDAIKCTIVDWNVFGGSQSVVYGQAAFSSMLSRARTEDQSMSSE